MPIKIVSLDEGSGMVFTLNCTSTGSPPTNVTWIKDDDVISEDDSYEVIQTLRDGVTTTYDNILKVHLHLSEIIGTYTCMIDNSVSTPVEQTIKLEVSDST